MNTISNGVYRPVQKLHPPSLLNQFVDQAATGCLQLSSGSSLWFLYLDQGQLAYASDLIDPFGRLDRHLRRMTAQATGQSTGITSAVRVQVRLMFETPTADQQTQGSDYQAICWLVEQQHLTSQQAAELIEAMVREVIDAFLPIQTGSYELIQADLLAEFPKFCQLDLRALLDDSQTQMRYRQSSLPPFSTRYSSPSGASSGSYRDEGQPEGRRSEGQQTNFSSEADSASDPAIERLLSNRFRSFLPSNRFSTSPAAGDESGSQRNWRQEPWREQSNLSSAALPPSEEADRPELGAEAGSDTATAEPTEPFDYSQDRNLDYGNSDYSNSGYSNPDYGNPDYSQTYQQSHRQDDRNNDYSERPEGNALGFQSSVETAANETAADSAPGYRPRYGAESDRRERLSRLSAGSAGSIASTSSDASSAELDLSLPESGASEAPILSEAIRETPPNLTQPDASSAEGRTYGGFEGRSYSSWTNRDRSRSDRSSRRTGFDRTSEPAEQDSSSLLGQQFRALRTAPTQPPSPAPDAAQPPAAAPPIDPALDGSPSLAQFAQANSSGRTYTIACIDDSPTVLQAIKGFLDDKSLSVVLISDPVKALMQIIRTRPDLILLDVTMPNLDGYELCSLLRKHPGFRGTPIVMVTSSTGFIDRAKAKLVGASGYLTKPFTQTDLLKIVFKHLN